MPGSTLNANKTACTSICPAGTYYNLPLKVSSLILILILLVMYELYGFMCFLCFRNNL